MKKKQTAGYGVIAVEKVQFFKTRKCCNELAWKIGNACLSYKRYIQEFDNNKKEAVHESGSTFFQVFVSSAQQVEGEERMTGV